ncbi:MAG: aryl-sulfate sulfotransferase [Rhodospirillales bacterium]|nr:aryl-sulfate sulfotransferase [Rhodospirillales bacterium]MSP81111.1 aryl-sulfate sulfotransferase [Rhodospirillales bacterium]
MTPSSRDPVRLRKRSVRIGGHDTSVSLEGAFWDALGAIARTRKISLNALVAAVDRDRRGNLSSALRLFVLESLGRRD